MFRYSVSVFTVLALTGTMNSMSAPSKSPSREPGVFARYRVLPGEAHKTPPMWLVQFSYQPVQKASSAKGCSWQLEAFAEDNPESAPLFQLRAITSRDPFDQSGKLLDFYRYQLRLPETGETYEYRDVNNPERALLPPWDEFVNYFIPQIESRSGFTSGMPNTCKYLGHVLTLRETGRVANWPDWKDVNVLNLNRELLVGTGRTVKDKEEHRLSQEPDRQNYTYVPWTPENYDSLIESGFNYFGLTPGIEESLRQRPVFYMRGAAKGNALRFPADLYRSNYMGPVMFIDEPSCIMTGEENFYNFSRYFSDASAMIPTRVRTECKDALHSLESQLKSQGVNLGDMRLAQTDFASWETRYSTAWYQYLGGVKGFVHEGRYQLKEFNEFAKASTGLNREYTAEEMFKYICAVMRGPAEQFGADWGISIYGQADPEITPVGIKVAYDMGARYVWFWTSDHDHHMPWPEQLALSRILKEHAAANPRLSIRGPRPVRDKLITIPYGYLLELESPTTRKNCWDLWWIRELDAEGKNAASQKYNQVRRKVMEEVNKSLDKGEDFNISIDDGREIKGYRKVVRVESQ